MSLWPDPVVLLCSYWTEVSKGGHIQAEIQQAQSGGFLVTVQGVGLDDLVGDFHDSSFVAVACAPPSPQQGL